MSCVGSFVFFSLSCADFHCWVWIFLVFFNSLDFGVLARAFLGDVALIGLRIELVSVDIGDFLLLE